MISSQKLINSISSITERGAKTCKKTSDRNYTSDLKMARKQSFHLRSPVIHRHLAEGPEIWPKSEDTGCAKGKTKAQEIQEYWECVTTTFAKSWNSCSDTGSSPMLVITWEQNTIQYWHQQRTQLSYFWHDVKRWIGIRTCRSSSMVSLPSSSLVETKMKDE